MSAKKNKDRLISNHDTMLRMRKHREKKKREKMCGIAWANAHASQTPEDWNLWDVIPPDDDESHILWGKVSPEAEGGVVPHQFHVEMVNKACGWSDDEGTAGNKAPISGLPFPDKVARKSTKHTLEEPVKINSVPTSVVSQAVVVGEHCAALSSPEEESSTSYPLDKQVEKQSNSHIPVYSPTGAKRDELQIPPLPTDKQGDLEKDSHKGDKRYELPCPPIPIDKVVDIDKIGHTGDKQDPEQPPLNHTLLTTGSMAGGGWENMEGMDTALSQKNSTTYVDLVMAPPATDFVGTFCGIPADPPSGTHNSASLHASQLNKCQQSYIVLSNPGVHTSRPPALATQPKSKSPPKKKRLLNHARSDDLKLNKSDMSHNKELVVPPPSAENVNPGPPTADTCLGRADISTCKDTAKESSNPTKTTNAKDPVDANLEVNNVSLDTKSGYPFAPVYDAECFESLTSGFSHLTISSGQSIQSTDLGDAPFRILQFLPNKEPCDVFHATHKDVQREGKTLLINRPHFDPSDHQELAPQQISHLAIDKSPSSSKFCPLSSRDRKCASGKYPAGGKVASSPTKFPVKEPVCSKGLLNQTDERNSEERMHGEGKLIIDASIDNSLETLPYYYGPAHGLSPTPHAATKDGPLLGQNLVQEFANTSEEGPAVTGLSRGDIRDISNSPPVSISQENSLVGDLSYHSYSPEEGPDTNDEDVDRALYDSSSTDALESLPDLDMDSDTDMDAPQPSFNNGSCDYNNLTWCHRLGLDPVSSPHLVRPKPAAQMDPPGQPPVTDQSSDRSQAVKHRSAAFNTPSPSMLVTQTSLPLPHDSTSTTISPLAKGITAVSLEESLDTESEQLVPEDRDSPSSVDSFVSAQSNCSHQYVVEGEANIPRILSPLKLCRPPLHPDAVARVRTWLSDPKTE